MSGVAVGSPLTLLYAPGDRADRVWKAYGSGADSIVIDLEDAVAPENKADARSTLAGLIGVVTALPAAHRPGIQVRINAPGTEWHDADLSAIAALPRNVSVRVPKCESAADVQRVCDRLPARRVHLLVESAIGVERAYDLASAHRHVASIGLGEADLTADLGVIDEDGLTWARSRIVVASAAAGLQSPAMSVYPHVTDLDGLRASCLRGRALGFRGRAAIHPRQLDVIRETFRPTEAEVSQAQAVLSALPGGQGAAALPDGTFVDAAVMKQARRLITSAEA